MTLETTASATGTLNRPTEATAPVAPARTLTRHDRCDASACGTSCRAQAFVLATKDGLELLFCGHHAAEYLPVLIGQGFAILDERSKINEKPSTSANAS